MLRLSLFGLNKNISSILIKIIILDIIATVIYLALAYDTDHWILYGDDHKMSDDSLYEKVINRFYYSVNVSTTLGLGPVSPNSKITILLTILQIYMTISLLPFAY